EIDRAVERPGARCNRGDSRDDVLGLPLGGRGDRGLDRGRRRRLVHGLAAGEGAGAAGEGRGAGVHRGDRVRPDRQRGRRGERRGPARERAGAEGGRAVLERHRAGRRAAGGGDGGGERDRLAVHGGAGRGGDRGRGRRHVDRLGERAGVGVVVAVARV